MYPTRQRPLTTKAPRYFTVSLTEKATSPAAQFASVLTKNHGYIGRMRPLFSKPASALAFFVAAFVATAAMAQSVTPAPATDKPAAKLRSIPYVSITGADGKQRHYETNAIPLLFNRACFGWRMYLGGPNRTVNLTEVLTTSQPAEQGIAGPAGNRRPRDAGQPRQDQGHHPHARGGAGRCAAALVVHHPGRPAGHLHLRHLDRRRAARRVRVLRHRGARPERQHRSARPELPQQVQLGPAPSVLSHPAQGFVNGSASRRPVHPRWL